MRPQKLFHIVTASGLGIAMLLVLAAITQSSFYADIVQGVFPNHEVAVSRSSYLHAGIAGGLWVGWSVTVLLLARNERLAKEPALWNAISYGLVFWYVTDSLASVLTGGVLNVVGNTFYFGLMLWPALAMKRQTGEAVATSASARSIGVGTAIAQES